jgi:hypothetical protein
VIWVFFNLGFAGVSETKVRHLPRYWNCMSVAILVEAQGRVDLFTF